MAEIKALTLDIFDNKNIGNCSNHGISEKYKKIYIPDDHGPVNLDSENLPDNYCIVEEININGKTYRHLTPLYIIKQGRHSMFGGAFAYTSDSRFASKYTYPLPIHDRIE